jgi:septal ring factor EnvC (AmiA/AmiB activator)
MASAVNATAAGAQARVGRYWDQLREATAAITTEPYVAVRRPSVGGSPGVIEEEASGGFEKLKDQLKRSKWSYIDADKKLSFNKGCTESPAPWANVDGSRERQQAMQDAKQQNKALKNDVCQEEKAQQSLMKALSEAYEDARIAHETCSRDLEELSFSQRDLSDIGAELVSHALEGEDLDFCPSGRDGPHGQAAREAAQGTADLQRVTSQIAVESKKRSRLEAEVARLEHELRQRQAETAAFDKQRAQEHAMASHLETTRQRLRSVFQTSPSTLSKVL